VLKINSHLVQFRYKKPYFLSLSFCGGLPLIPVHRYQPEQFKGDEKSLAEYFNSHPDNWKPIGNGSYLFKEWKKSQVIILTKNKNYWAAKEKFPYFQKDQPYLDEIHYVIINNSNAALKELMSDNLDTDFDITQSIWEDPRTSSDSFNKKFARARYITPLYTYIGWNNKRPFFKDYRVRQAMTRLIPKEKILKEIHFGLGENVTGPFYSKGPIYDNSLPVQAYNTVLARKLLEEAGWVDHDGDGIRDKDGVKFEFEYLIHNAKEYHQKIADIIKESLEEAGIVMHIRMIDWTIFAQTVAERNFDAVRFAWGTGIDDDPFQIWHSSQIGGGGSNFISYSNPEVDQIIESGRNIFDPIRRWALFRRLHQILYQEQPYTFLFSLDALAIYHRKFRGVKFYSSGYNLNEWYIADGK
jgi:peptide/nickel transport system substrate-binding protein